MTSNDHDTPLQSKCQSIVFIVDFAARGFRWCQLLMTSAWTGRTLDHVARESKKDWQKLTWCNANMMKHTSHMILWVEHDTLYLKYEVSNIAQHVHDIPKIEHYILRMGKYAWQLLRNNSSYISRGTKILYRKNSWIWNVDMTYYPVNCCISTFQMLQNIYIFQTRHRISWKPTVSNMCHERWARRSLSTWIDKNMVRGETDSLSKLSKV